MPDDQIEYTFMMDPESGKALMIASWRSFEGVSNHSGSVCSLTEKEDRVEKLTMASQAYIALRDRLERAVAAYSDLPDFKETD